MNDLSQITEKETSQTVQRRFLENIVGFTMPDKPSIVETEVVNHTDLHNDSHADSIVQR